MTLVPVESAFNGLAFYKVDAVFGPVSQAASSESASSFPQEQHRDEHCLYDARFYEYLTWDSKWNNVTGLRENHTEIT